MGMVLCGCANPGWMVAGPVRFKTSLRRGNFSLVAFGLSHGVYRIAEGQGGVCCALRTAFPDRVCFGAGLPWQWAVCGELVSDGGTRYRIGDFQFVAIFFTRVVCAVYGLARAPVWVAVGFLGHGRFGYCADAVMVQVRLHRKGASAPERSRV